MWKLNLKPCIILLKCCYGISSIFENFFNSKTSLYASKRKLSIHKHQDLNISVVRNENIRVNKIYHIFMEFSCHLTVLSDHFIFQSTLKYFHTFLLSIICFTKVFFQRTQFYFMLYFEMSPHTTINNHHSQSHKV